MCVSRQLEPGLVGILDGADPEEDGDPEYTLLILIPPTNAVFPSTTSNLRWSRLLINHPRFAASGLTGLNSTTRTPPSRNRSKNSLGVFRQPTLSKITLT